MSRCLSLSFDCLSLSLSLSHKMQPLLAVSVFRCLYIRLSLSVSLSLSLSQASMEWLSRWTVSSLRLSHPSFSLPLLSGSL
ncbi:hypothetical protein FKM82_029545 [Ascaphus truei]